MANELQVAGSISFTPAAGATLAEDFARAYFTVSGVSGIGNIISVGTSDESLALGDISTIGWVYFRNLDATNFISIGSDGTLYPIKLKAGEFALMRWNAAAIHVKANTGACNFKYLLTPD